MTTEPKLTHGIIQFLLNYLVMATNYGNISTIIWDEEATLTYPSNSVDSAGESYHGNCNLQCISDRPFTNVPGNLPISSQIIQGLQSWRVSCVDSTPCNLKRKKRTEHVSTGLLVWPYLHLCLMHVLLFLLRLRIRRCIHPRRSWVNQVVLKYGNQ